MGYADTGGGLDLAHGPQVVEPFATPKPGT